MGNALRMVGLLIVGLCVFGIIISVVNKANGHAGALDGLPELVGGLVSGLLIGGLGEICTTLLNIYDELKSRPKSASPSLAIHGPHQLRVIGKNFAGRPMERIVSAMTHDEASLQALAAGMLEVDRIESA